MIGVLALAFLPELKSGLVFGFGVTAALAYFFLPRLPDRYLFFSLLSLVATVLFLFWGSNLSQALLFSSAILIAHALLWLSVSPTTYRYWRVGVAFLEIILAAVLAPEAHMFVLIFAFVLVSSLALSFGFIEKNFSLHQPNSLEENVPPGFLGSLVGLSIGIFLSSLAIFPLLPRSNWAGLGGDWAQSGYRETISFREGSLGWAAGESKTVVWLFLPKGKTWEQILPRSLLRMKTLEWFDGMEWAEGSKQTSPMVAQSAEPADLEIVREALPSAVLPVPYGTSGVFVKEARLNRMESGEWPVSALVNKRVEYMVSLGGKRLQDSPRDIHRKIPAMAQLPTVQKLSSDWNRENLTDRQKIERVMSYLRGFRYELLPLAAAGKGPHPIELFLQKKAGHCELFATSAALFLRLMGIPSRIVVGFRTGDSESSVLTVKNSDAHAWLEAWLPGEGWMVLDPTPLQARPSSFWRPWEEAYDFVQAYWNKYILSYEFSSLYPFFLKLAGVLLALVLLVQLKRFLFWSKPSALASNRAELIRAKKKLDKLLKNDLARKAFWLSHGSSLHRKYEQLRFGRHSPSKEVVETFYLESKQSIQKFVAAQNSDSVR